MANVVDVLVIGAGLAGLTAAWQAAAAGKSVRIVAKGWGTTHWHTGCLDVLGYQPFSHSTFCDSPKRCIPDLIKENPLHPYALAGVDVIDEACLAVQSLCRDAGYPMRGSTDRNWLLPSAVGAFRPTCLAPATMTAGDLRSSNPTLIVGFRQLGDFYADLAAANLRQQGIPAKGADLQLDSLSRRRHLNTTALASLFDTSSFREEVVGALRHQLRGAQRVGFPAVLGMERPMEVTADLEAQLGCPVFEIPTLPPSVPGMRLHRILAKAIRMRGGQLLDGIEAIGAEYLDRRVVAVKTEAAARIRRLQAQSFVLATGGILGGGVTGDRSGRVRETIFDLPISAPKDRSEWFRREYFSLDGHPVFSSGVSTDEQLRPADGNGQALFENLFAAGAVLAHHDGIRERSSEGVALATGFAVGRKVGQYATG